MAKLFAAILWSSGIVRPRDEITYTSFMVVKANRLIFNSSLLLPTSLQCSPLEHSFNFLLVLGSHSLYQTVHKHGKVIGRLKETMVRAK